MWFVRRHFEKDNESITIWGRNGKTWTINYHPGIGCNGERRAELRSVWRIFVRVSPLKMGDVCVFELIKSPFYFTKGCHFPKQY